MRITGQLIDAATGTHLWADRFDGELEDIFGVQDQVTASVVGAIAPKLERAEIERAKRKPTESLDAYDYYLRGMASFHRWTRRGQQGCAALFYRAIEIDPDFALAYGMAALCYAQRMMNGWMVDRKQETSKAALLAERAVELGRDDAVALSSAGIARLRVVGEIDAAAAFIERALALNPNLAQAWYGASFVKNCNGEPELALQYLNHAMRLSPIDPLMYNLHTGTALAHFWRAGTRIRIMGGTGIARQSEFLPGVADGRGKSCARRAAGAGKDAIARLRELDPTLRISHLKEILPLRRADDSARFAEGLRMAGLPE